MDGKYSKGIESGVHFDYDGDGFAEKTAWIDSEDGLLVRDINGNGTIDNGSELFGDRTILSNGSFAEDGFEAMADIDENKDGILDSADVAFSELRVWVDKNADGITQSEELFNMEELAIEAILLNRSETSRNENGNIISGMANIVKNDGRSMNLAELNFSIDYSDTKYTGNIEIPDYINVLPQLLASGKVLSLHEAMSVDEELYKMVNEYVNNTDVVAKKNMLNKIVLRWTGCEKIEVGSRGGDIDAARLAVIEKLCGTGFIGVNGSNPNSAAARILNELYNDILEKIEGKLLIQTDLKEIIGKTKVVTQISNGQRYVNYSEVIEMFDGIIAENFVDGMVMFREYVLYISKLSSVSHVYSVKDLYKYVESSRYEAYYKMSLENNILYGTEEGEKLFDGSNSTIIVGGKGNDILTGGYGVDTYIVSLGDGQNIIINNDRNNWSEDRILFTDGIMPEDIAVFRRGNDMVFLNEKSGDSITVQNAYTDGSGWNYLGKVEFFDGTVWGMSELNRKTRVLDGTDGNDTIYGNGWGYNYNQSELITTYGGDDVINAGDGDDIIDAGEGNDRVYAGTGDDVITGGTGNDTLVGGYGTDTYVFNLGNGQDIISNNDRNNWSEDRILFTEGIMPEDIAVFRRGNDMVFLNEKIGDSITVQNAYTDGSGWNYLGKVEFFDGTVWGMSELNRKTRVLDGTDGNDTIYGNGWGYNYNQSELITTYGGDDVINAGDGDDIIDAGEGNDRVYAGAGDDVITGGTGNDTLVGGYGADTYVFNLGDGQDIISNNDRNNWSEDRILFTEGIMPEDIAVFRRGNDMVFLNEKSGDSITVQNAYTDGSGWNYLGKVEFFDGTVWGMSEFNSWTRVLDGTDGNDTIYGNGWGYNYNQSELITAYGGDDVINAGDGDDIIDAGDGNDTVNAGEGNHMIDAGDGDDRIYAGAGEDVIIGGTGNDTLAGGYGADTYVFNLGDGQDIISNNDRNNWSEDRILFTEGIMPEDIAVFRRGNDMVFLNEKIGDSITVQNAYTDGSGWNYLGKVEFFDGTVWGMSEFNSWTRVLDGTDGNDTIYGNGWGYNYNQSELITTYGGDDVINAGDGDDIIDAGEGNDRIYAGTGDDLIIGGKGDDILAGDYGSDTYVFDKDFGSDTIIDNIGSNKVSFNDGIEVEMLNLFRTGTDLEINIVNSTDKITIANYFMNDSFKNFTYEFATGEKLNQNDIEDIMNGTFIYNTTLKNAEMLSDIMSISDSDTGIFAGNTAITTETVNENSINQLWAS